MPQPRCSLEDGIVFGTVNRKTQSPPHPQHLMQKKAAWHRPRCTSHTMVASRAGRNKRVSKTEKQRRRHSCHAGQGQQSSCLNDTTLRPLRSSLTGCRQRLVCETRGEVFSQSAAFLPVESTQDVYLSILQVILGNETRAAPHHITQSSAAALRR
jgi:hypothetical protein